MTQPFRFRYTNQLVGGFVLLILLALSAGVFLAGRAQNWFETVIRIEAAFPPEGTFGLQRGAEVHILGTPVGTVHQIRVEEDDSMHAVLDVQGDFIRFIRLDSEAVVKRKFGLAGDAFVEITVGTGPPIPLEPAPTLPIRRDTELVEMLTDLVERVETAVLPAIDEVTATLQEYRMLATTLQAQEGELQQSLSHVREILRGLESGEGSAGRFLRDATLAEEIEGVLEQVREILSDVQAATSRLPAMAEVVESELRDVPGTLLQSRATLHEAEMLLAGLQRHWLLRKYMITEEPLEILSVEWMGPTEER